MAIKVIIWTYKQKASLYFFFFTPALKENTKKQGGENVFERKQIKKQKQSSRNLKIPDVLEFMMSDVSHIAHTLDRILEVLSHKSTAEKAN